MRYNYVDFREAIQRILDDDFSSIITLYEKLTKLRDVLSKCYVLGNLTDGEFDRLDKFIDYTWKLKVEDVCFNWTNGKEDK